MSESASQVGLVSEDKHIPILLQNVQVKVKLVDFCAEVVLLQTYKNTETTPIEAM
jgi:hypothetical protein